MINMHMGGERRPGHRADGDGVHGAGWGFCGCRRSPSGALPVNIIMRLIHSSWPAHQVAQVAKDAARYLAEVPRSTPTPCRIRPHALLYDAMAGTHRACR